MNTCIICLTKQSGQNSYCSTCGYSLRLPKFLSKEQYKAWFTSEILSQRIRWNIQRQQKQIQENTQEIAALKNMIVELQKQNAALTAAMQEITDLKLPQIGLTPPIEEMIAEVKRLTQTSQQPVPSSVTKKPAAPKKTKSSANPQKKDSPSQQKPVLSPVSENWEFTPDDVNLSMPYTVPDGVTKIGDFAFQGYGNLKTIDLPDSVQTIGNYAFDHCVNLQEIRLSDSIRTIGNCAFQYCTSLQKIRLPAMLKKIGNFAFAYCTELYRIHLPSSLTQISAFAFSGCAKLREVRLPDTLTKIDDTAFFHVHAVIYYPSSCSGKDWVGKDYGGNLIWKPY